MSVYMCHILVCVTHILELKDLLSSWYRSAGRVGLLGFYPKCSFYPHSPECSQDSGWKCWGDLPPHPARHSFRWSLCCPSSSCLSVWNLSWFLPSTRVSDLSVPYVFSSVIVCLVQFYLAFIESLGSVRSGFSAVTTPSLYTLRSTVSAELRGPASNPSDICVSSSTSLFLRA